LLGGEGRPAEQRHEAFVQVAQLGGEGQQAVALGGVGAGQVVEQPPSQGVLGVVEGVAGLAQPGQPRG
jgi:hypothetical protein